MTRQDTAFRAFRFTGNREGEAIFVVAEERGDRTQSHEKRKYWLGCFGGFAASATAALIERAMRRINRRVRKPIRQR